MEAEGLPVHWEPGKSYAGLPLPEKFYGYIGGILAGWSAFLENLDDFLLAMCHASGKNYPDIDQRYKNRAKVFRDLVGATFPERPLIVTEIQYILDLGSACQQDRNLFAHGRVICSSEDSDTLVVSGRLNGADIEKRYALNDLVLAYSAVSHLSGRFWEITILAVLDKNGPLHRRVGPEDAEMVAEFCLQYHPKLKDFHRQ